MNMWRILGDNRYDTDVYNQKLKTKWSQNRVLVIDSKFMVPASNFALTSRIRRRPILEVLQLHLESSTKPQIRRQIIHFLVINTSNVSEQNESHSPYTAGTRSFFMLSDSRTVQILSRKTVFFYIFLLLVRPTERLFGARRARIVNGQMKFNSIRSVRINM